MNHNARCALNAGTRFNQAAHTHSVQRIKPNYMALMVSAVLGCFAPEVIAEDKSRFEVLPVASQALPALSGDGRVVVIYGALNGDFATMLLDANGTTPIASPGGVFEGRATNYDGAIVVGDFFADADHLRRAYRWTQSSGLELLGTLGESSTARKISADGNVIIGAFLDNRLRSGFRWTESTGMVDLGHFNGQDTTLTGVNKDGSVIVGTAWKSGGIGQAFIWTQDTGMEDMGNMGGTSTSANVINADGTVVAGDAEDAFGVAHAYRWTRESGFQSLGFLDGGQFATVIGMNANGNVIVGASATSTGIGGFRWANGIGMQRVEDWLIANGVAVDQNAIRVSIATDVSADGNTVVGILDTDERFIARVSAGRSGLINVSDYTAGLHRAASSTSLAYTSDELIVQGMNGSPIQKLLPAGRSGFWVNGDAGRDEHGSHKGTLGVISVGGGYRLNETYQFNINVGQNYRQADTDHGGQTFLRYTFLMPELMIALPDALHLSIAGFYSDGRIDINRGYQNAGITEMARGDASVKGAGARLRLDWLNAARLGSVSVSPYASLTYMQSKLSSYTEASGAFPVKWDSRKEKNTTARLGVDLSYAVTETTKLNGRIEGAHRFDTQTAEISGDILGVNTFGFDGARVKQNWLRLGLGVEGKVGNGIAAVMLNATTQNSGPAYWLAANYRWLF